MHGATIKNIVVFWLYFCHLLFLVRHNGDVSPQRNSSCWPVWKQQKIIRYLRALLSWVRGPYICLECVNSYVNSDNILSCKCPQPKRFGRESCWIDPSSHLALMAKRKLLPVTGIEVVMYPILSFCCEWAVPPCGIHEWPNLLNLLSVLRPVPSPFQS